MVFSGINSLKKVCSWLAVCAFLIFCISILFVSFSLTVISFGIVLICFFLTFRVFAKKYEKLINDEKRFCEELASCTGHDIRTPVSSLMLLPEICSFGSANDSLMDPIDVINRSTDRLNEIADQLSSISKLKKNRDDFFNGFLNPHQVFEDLESDFSDKLLGDEPKVKFEVSSDIPRWVVGDEELLLKVVGGFINSLSAMPSSSSITVAAKTNKRLSKRKSAISINITDPSVVISDDDLSNIRFPRGICGPVFAANIRFIEAIDGSVFVSSSADSGTSIKLNVPLKVSGVKSC